MRALKIFITLIFLALPISTWAGGPLDNYSPDELAIRTTIKGRRTTTVIRSLADPDEITTTTGIIKRAASYSGDLTIYGQGGAPLQTIMNNIKADQTPLFHADIWIVEGGVNDIKWYSGPSDPPYFWTEYEGFHNQIQAYAQSCGVKKLYLQEMTPVVPDLVNNDPYWMGLDVPGKLPRMNGVIHQLARTYGCGVIVLYDAFFPYWADWSYGTSVHPNATGVDHLAQVWAEGIQDNLTPNVSIYVAGDSIVNCVSPAVFLEKINRQLALDAARPVWNQYE